MATKTKTKTTSTKKAPAHTVSQGAKLTGLAAVFPARLRAIREKKGLKQDEVATKANLSNAYISMLERGARTPPLETVDAVAKALGVPALALLQAA